MSSPANSGWMLSDVEYSYLAKFRRPAYVRREDLFAIRQLTSWGLLEMGFASHDSEPYITETAKLTDFGAKILRRERRMRNPLWRGLYRFASLIL